MVKMEREIYRFQQEKKYQDCNNLYLSRVSGKYNDSMCDSFAKAEPNQSQLLQTIEEQKCYI